MKHAYHILAEILLLFLLAVLFFQYKQIKNERDALQASKQGLDFELKLRSDSMTEPDHSIAYLNHLADSLFDESDILYFKKKGLNNPEKELLNSLYRQQDLIPREGVLGGTMKIWNAVLLGRHWAIAYFEDGHVGGNMILKHTVEEGNIQWQILDNSFNNF
ncbi:MAG TPA: hypothetical protein VIR29_02390 [Anseongella sp.]